MSLWSLMCSAESTGLTEDEIGPYWVPLGLVLRLKPDGKVEATDMHDEVSFWHKLLLRWK